MSTAREGPLGAVAVGDDSGDGVAVIGMSGRFPGAANLDAYWRNLCAGMEAVTFFSDEELREAGVDPAQIAHPHYVKAAPLLDGIEGFEPGFFGLSPREAQVLDPQIRLFLECAWEVFENAGYDPGRLAVACGVYGGMRLSDYLMHNVYSNPEVLATVGDFQAVLGNDKDYLTTLISYKLNLTGPSLAVQSACSTSLVAIHLASEALNNRECDLALAGGAAVRLPARSGYFYHPESVFSLDGHCRPFDSKAGGTIFGSGVGAVLLKRLEDARRDGDTILAVIRGSAINNDGGQKVGFTAPAVSGQARVVADCLALADLDPADISYIECHGTGTPLGDPIEIAALKRVFQGSDAGREQDGHRCAIGSVKGNIGHLESAAGIASFQKTVLMLHHGELVPSLHFNEPNPQLHLETSPFYVSTDHRPWPREAGDGEAGPRRAGVSSFGIGGTNAHVILEEAPLPPEPAPSRSHQLLLLSARTPAALDAMSERLAARLDSEAPENLPDIAHTLQMGRRPFHWRRMVVCRDPKEGAAALRGQREGAALTGQIAQSRDGGDPPPVIFLFPGQGAQYPGMAAGLYGTGSGGEARFREIVDHGCAILQPILRQDGVEDLRSLLFPREETAGLGMTETAELLQQTALTQPALFLLGYALARQWQEWGIEPAAMIGHSIGEYVAACLAEVFTFEEGLALVAERGRLMQAMPPGMMLAVSLPEARLTSLLVPGVDLAAVNGPELCVVSGPNAAVGTFRQRLEDEGIEYRSLHTSHAFHSGMMDPILDLFAEHLSRVPLRPPQRRWISNVTGRWIEPAEATDPRYWVRHLREPVRFAAGVATLLAEHPGSVFLEAGPGRTLSNLVRRAAPAGSPPPLALPSLRHPQDEDDDTAFLLRSLGRLWLSGAEVNWQEFYRHESRRRVPLPTYPFERQRCWIDPQSRHRWPTGKKGEVGEWFYVPGWRRTAPLRSTAAPQPQGQGERWWIFLDENESALRPVADALAIRLEEAGREVLRIPPEHNVAFSGSLPDHAVYARGADHNIELLMLAAQLEEAAAPITLTVLGHHLFEIGAEGPPMDGAVARALSEVAAQHRSGVRLRVVDLGPGEAICSATTVDVAWREILDGRDEAVVAWRGGHRWRPALEAVTLEAPAPPPWQEESRRGGWHLFLGELPAAAVEMATSLHEALDTRFLFITEKAVPPSLQAVAHHLPPGSGEEEVVAAVAAAEEAFGPLRGISAFLGWQAGASAGGSGGREERGSELLEQVQRVEAIVRSLMALPPLPVAAGRWLWTPAAPLWHEGGPESLAAVLAAAVAEDFAARRRDEGERWTAVRFDGWTSDEPRFPVTAEESLEALGRLLEPRDLPSVVLSCGDPQARREAARSSGQGAAIAQAGDAREAPGLEEGAMRPGIQTPYAAPRDELEQQLADLWQEQLGVETVGITDDFFDLGGHSLLATRVLARVQRALGVEISLRALFDRATVAGMAETIRAARQDGSARMELPPIEPVPRDGDLPLASPQERLWFLDQLEPNSPTYNLTGAFPAPPELDPEFLRRALTELVRRHEILRTVFPGKEGRGVQVIRPPEPFPLPVIDLRLVPAEERLREAARQTRQEAETPFDLAEGPLLRGFLLRLDEAEYRVVLSLHHIIADGWSFNVLQQEIAEIYRALVEEREPRLPALSIQYADYAAWQRQRVEGEEHERLLGYWRRQLAGVPLLLDLPLDFPRKAPREPWGARQHLELDHQVASALKTLGWQENASLFMVLLALFDLLLGHEGCGEDFLVGTDVANRPLPELEPLVGLFVNQVVLRADLSGEPSFRDLVRRVRETSLEAFAHQELPLESVIRELAPERSPNHNPVFQVLFLLQNFPEEESFEGGGAPEPEDERIIARFDLKAELRETGGAVRGCFEGRTDLFKESSLERMTTRYQRLASLAVEDPDQSIVVLRRQLDDEERRESQKKWKDLKKTGLSKLRERLRK